jgi:hypothetical protein
MNGAPARKVTWIPQSIMIPLLLWALHPYNPYDYYVFLRVVCFGCFGYLALRAFERDMFNAVFVFGFTALIYNPFVPLHSTRELWTVLNLLTIGVSLWALYIVNPGILLQFTRIRTDVVVENTRPEPGETSNTFTFKNLALDLLGVEDNSRPHWPNVLLLVLFAFIGTVAVLAHFLG